MQVHENYSVMEKILKLVNFVISEVCILNIQYYAGRNTVLSRC